MGAAFRGGFKAIRGRQAQSYAARAADMLTNQDPAVLMEHLKTTHADQGFQDFMSSLDNGMKNAGQAAGQQPSP